MYKGTSQGSLSEDVIQSMKKYFRKSNIHPFSSTSEGYNSPLSTPIPDCNIEFVTPLDLHNIFFFMKAQDPKEVLKNYIKEFTSNIIVFLTNNNKQTLLHIATINKSLICVKLLLDNGKRNQKKNINNK